MKPYVKHTCVVCEKLQLVCWVVWVKLACGLAFGAIYDQAFIVHYSRKDAAMLSLAFTVALRKTTGYEKRHRKQVTVEWESSDWCFLNNQLNWINFKKYVVKESLGSFEVWKILNTTDWHSRVEIKFTYPKRDDENWATNGSKQMDFYICPQNDVVPASTSRG